MTELSEIKDFFIENDFGCEEKGYERVPESSYIDGGTYWVVEFSKVENDFTIFFSVMVRDFSPSEWWHEDLDDKKYSQYWIIKCSCFSETFYYSDENSLFDDEFDNNLALKKIERDYAKIQELIKENTNAN